MWSADEIEVAETESRLASGRARCLSIILALRSSEMGSESRLSRLLGVETPESNADGGAREVLSRDGGSMEMVRWKELEFVRCWEDE